MHVVGEIENPQVNIQLQEKRWYGNILIKQGG
nr:MAG TPA: hypothetical protein [Caudoviricetes sp.]